MKRAAIYARVSKAYAEDDERTTIESQLADCEEYCQKHGYEIVGRYVDSSKYRARGTLVNPSGTRKDRPAYVKLLKDAAAGDVDVIVAWKEDRLYRGMYAALPLSEMLDEARGAVAVELVLEVFDHRMLGIKSAVAKIELDNIRDRMVRGRRARLERGEVPGGPTKYGYARGEDNRLVIVEAEAGVVRQIFEWYIAGESNQLIRGRLTAMGVPPRIAKAWAKPTINTILTNEGYATGQYATALSGEQYVIGCPPIISQATWDKALEMRDFNTSHRSRNVKEDYLCRGLVVCPCGWRWGARTCGNSKDYGGKWGYYSCAKKDHKPEDVHPDCPGTIGAKKLDAFVWAFVVRVCSDPAVIRDAIDAKIGQLEAEQESTVDEAGRLQREWDKIQTERNWCITAARTGKITTEDLEYQLGALHFQAIDLRKRLNEAGAATAAQTQAQALKDWAETYLADIHRGIKVLETDGADLDGETWEQLYRGLEAIRFESKFDGDRQAALRWAIFEERRRIVRTLISRVLVVKGPNGEKMIVPQLVLEIPRDFASLVYDHQSLEYVEQVGQDAGRASEAQA